MGKVSKSLTLETLTQFDLPEKIVQMCMGDMLSVILTSSGLVYTMGEDIYCSLGTNNPNKNKFNQV